MPESRSIARDAAGSIAVSDGRDGPIAAAIAGLVIVTVLIGVLVPGTPSHRAAAAPSEDAACAEWSDGCRVCRRVGDGIACSLPGIACVPAAAPRCERRVGD